MSLTDLMSSADLTIYPELALVIFLGIFAANTLSLLRGDKRRFDRAAKLPLEDEK